MTYRLILTIFFEKKIEAKVFFDKNLTTKLSYVFPFMTLKNRLKIQNHLEINLRGLDKLFYDLKRLSQNLNLTQKKKIPSEDMFFQAISR